MKKILLTIIIIIFIILIAILGNHITNKNYNKCLQNGYSKTQCNELLK